MVRRKGGVAGGGGGGTRVPGGWRWDGEVKASLAGVWGGGGAGKGRGGWGIGAGGREEALVVLSFPGLLGGKLVSELVDLARVGVSAAVGRGGAGGVVVGRKRGRGSGDREIVEGGSAVVGMSVVGPEEGERLFGGGGGRRRHAGGGADEGGGVGGARREASAETSKVERRAGRRGRQARRAGEDDG